MAEQDIKGINAIAVARGNTAPSNTEVVWLDTSITGELYEQLKTYDGSAWVQMSRTPIQVLDDLKTVDGAGSGLDADTLQGLTPAQLMTASGGTPPLAVGQLLVGQGDTIGTAQTIGGIATIDASGNLIYVAGSISHTNLTDIGTNTHAQIDSKLASIDNIEGNLTNLGTLGAGEDTFAVTWDNATSRFIMAGKTATARTPSLVVHTATSGSTTTGVVGLSLLVISDDATIDSVLVPTGFSVSYNANESDTVNPISYNAGTGSIYITYLT